MAAQEGRRHCILNKTHLTWKKNGKRFLPQDKLQHLWQDLISDKSRHARAASLSVYPDSQALTINEGKHILSVYNKVDEKQKIS